MMLLRKLFYYFMVKNFKVNSIKCTRDIKECGSTMFFIFNMLWQKVPLKDKCMSCRLRNGLKGVKAGKITNRDVGRRRSLRMIIVKILTYFVKIPVFCFTEKIKL